MSAGIVAALHGGTPRRRTGAARLALGAAIAMSVASAEPARAVALTLEQAEARALAASPAARAARLEVLAARARTGQAYARHLGEGDLVAAASRYEGARILRPITGPITPAAMAGVPYDRDQLRYGVAWQVPLFAGGALVLGDEAARLLERAAEDQAAHALEEIRYEVRAAYRSALGVLHALDAAAAYEEALARDEESAQLEVRTEAWSAADAAKVSFALASARARRAALEARRRDTMALLAALMGDEAMSDDALADVAPALAPDRRSPAELAAASERRRRDLAAAREASESQSKRASGVRAGFSPQLAFAGNVLWYAGPSLARPIETYELTLQLRIPILADVGRAFAAREADATAAQAAERERAKRLEVRRQVVDALGRGDAARAALEAGTSQRALGAEVARVEKLKLDAGTGKVEDYLAARAQELEGETGYWQALYAVQTANDYLALATGAGETP